MHVSTAEKWKWKGCVWWIFFTLGCEFSTKSDSYGSTRPSSGVGSKRERKKNRKKTIRICGEVSFVTWTREEINLEKNLEYKRSSNSVSWTTIKWRGTETTTTNRKKRCLRDMEGEFFLYCIINWIGLSFEYFFKFCVKFYIDMDWNLLLCSILIYEKFLIPLLKA
jgi:hypothetical protein